MAVPPSYADLGKSAKDIFNKGYGKFSYKSKDVDASAFKCSFKFKLHFKHILFIQDLAWWSLMSRQSRPAEL